MKWFQHMSDCHANKKMRRLELAYPDPEAFFAAYGRLWRLYEIVAYWENDGFTLPDGYGLDILARDLNCTEEYLNTFLNALAGAGLVDQEDWSKGIIAISKLDDHSAGYYKRKKRERAQDKEQSIRPLAGESPATIRLLADQSPANSLSTIQDNTKQNNTKSKTTPSGLSKEGGPSDDGTPFPPPKKKRSNPLDPLVYKGTYFDLRESIYNRLRKKAKLLTDEQFANLLENLEIYAAEHREKYARYVNGKLKNPGKILHKWLDKEVIRARPPKAEEAPKPPDKTESIAVSADQDCPDCKGTGFAPSIKPGFSKVCDCVKRKIGLKE